MITDKRELWKKSQRAILTPEERVYLIEQLQVFYETHEDPDGTEYLLMALEYEGYFKGELKTILEKLVIFPEACAIAAKALDLLCWDSHSTAKHLTQIKAFLKGVDWDIEDEGRMRDQSISIAGRYVKDTQDRECLSLLLSILDDELIDTNTRSYAYTHICRAVGREWKDIPTIDKWDRPAIDHLIDHEILNDVRNYISQQ
jgi:hypothetical protein